MTRRRWSRLVVGLLALASVAVLAWMQSESAGEAACRLLREEVPKATGLQLQIDRCQLDPLDAQVVVSGLRLIDPATGRDVVAADEARVALRGLVLGGVALSRVVLVRPKVELDLPKPKPEGSAPSSTCPLDPLRRLRVGSLDIEQAQLSLGLPDVGRLQIDGLDVRASLDAARGDVEAGWRGGSVWLVAQQKRLALGRASVQLGVELATNQLTVDRSTVNVEGASLSVNGAIEGLCDGPPRLALGGQVFVALQPLNRLGLGLPPLSGQVWAKVSIAGRLDAPTLRAEANASKVALGPFTPGDFSVRVAYANDAVTLEEFSTKVAGGGEILVSGEVGLTAGYPVTAKVQTKDASLARVLERASITGAWVDFPATVATTVTGKLVPLRLGGDVEFDSGPFTLASRAFDAPKTEGTDILQFAQAGGTFHLSVTDQYVGFEGAQLHAGVGRGTRASADVRLYFDLDKRGLDIRAQLDAVDLRDFGAIAELPWSGVGTARATIKGPPADLVIDGQLSLRDFKLAGYSLGVVQSQLRYVGDTLSFPGIAAQKGASQYFGDVALQFADEGLQTRALVQMPDGRAEDIIEILRDLSPSMENVVGDITGTLALVAAVDSPAKQLTGLIAVQAQDVAYQDRRLGAANLVLRFEDGERLVLDPTTFEGPLGRTTADGAWAFAGPLDFRLAVEAGRLGELVDPAGKRGWAIAGDLAATAVVSGTTDEVKLTGTLRSSNVLYESRPLGPLQLQLDFLGLELAYRGRVVDGVDLAGTLTLRGDVPAKARLSVSLPDVIAAFVKAGTGVTVGVSGTVDVVGPLKNVDALVASAQLSRLEFARGELTAKNVEPAELRWDKGALEVRALSLRGPAMQISAAGRWGPSTVDLSSSGFVDLRLLSSVTSLVERTAGRLDFTASFTGSVREPKLAGGADVSELRALVKGYDVALKNVSAHADFSESRVLIQDLIGFVNDGRLRGRGSAKLDKLSLKGLELGLDLDDVTVAVQPGLPATVSGTLAVDYRPELTQVLGSLELQKLHYTQPLTVDGLIASARAYRVPSDERPQEWLRFDIDVLAGDDVRVDNNLAKGRFAGKVKLAGTNVRPVLVGALEATENSQATFRGNTYVVTRGLLQFNNGLWPTFDLGLQTQIRDYLVKVKAFGRIDDPRVNLSSEPGLPESDLLTLVTLGVTSAQGLQQQAGLGLAAEALLSASGLDQQVQRFLKDSVGLKDQEVRFTTTYNEATGTTEPAVSWEGKVVVDNLKVSVTQPVTGRGTKAQAEYRFSRGASARAHWDNQNQNTSFGNPGVDVRWRFELE